MRRHDGCFESVQPGRLGQHSRDDVGDVKKRSRQKHFLHGLVLPLDHDQPDNHRTDGHRVVLAEAEQFQAARDSGKFRDHVAEIDDDQSDHHQERDAKAKLFANQVAQALAGDRAHAGRISCTTISARVIGIIVQSSM